MSYIKHKNMKDICAEIVSFEGGDSYKIWWMNLLGTYGYEKPFHLGTRKQGAIEIIKIANRQDWLVTNDLNDFRAVKTGN